jgi:hypothetical protein
MQQVNSTNQIKTYYVWVGTTMRSILFDSLSEAQAHQAQLLAQGMPNVSIEVNND